MTTSVFPRTSFAFFNFRRVRPPCSFFHCSFCGRDRSASVGWAGKASDGGRLATGTTHPFSLPLLASPSENLNRPRPEHSRFFFWHFLQTGSAPSQIIRRLEHWKQPEGQEHESIFGKYNIQLTSGLGAHGGVRRGGSNVRRQCDDVGGEEGKVAEGMERLRRHGSWLSNLIATHSHFSTNLRYLCMLLVSLSCIAV